MKLSPLMVLGLLLISPSLSYAQRGELIQRVLEKRLDRNAASNSGPTPDYTNLYFWAASPYKHDNADSIPTFLKNEIRTSSVDVFFIHPTSYLGTGEEIDLNDIAENRGKVLASVETAAWNADLNDAALNKRTDERTILNQATVFNGSCRIFAPRYRQANIKAFFVPKSNKAQAAFDLAYSDIKKAFQYYLEKENQGRPIIIASHSQGTLHAIRLLQEFFDGKPLQKQLVCAYAVGYQIEKNAFKSLPIGNSPTATGCVVGWRSYQAGEIPPIVQNENGNSICINPVTWTTSSEASPKEFYEGVLAGFNNLMGKAAISVSVEPSSKILWVSLPENVGANIKKAKNLHIFDYNLFWMNIRTNVKTRIDAYQKLNEK